jgi:dTDP-3-amino-3,4,6-trideoxy-alpha-D-glucose transaminase
VVPVVDLSRHGLELADLFSHRVAEIVHRGLFLLGPETEAFEHEFANWVGAPHAVAVASGASALQLSLAALGIGPGDEVIVPAFTAVPTAAAVCALGAVPVPVDVEAATANLDPFLVQSAITTRTRAVVVVHLYGRPATLPDVSVPIIEDAAQAHGAVEHDARSAAVCYSFYPTKNLGGIGDGGAVVTNEAAFADQVRRLRVHGMTQQYVHESVSQNFRMSELEAAWLRLGLERLTEWNGRRRAIAERYRSAAPRLRWQQHHDRHVHHLCVARFANRDAVRETLTEAGVATGVHYPLAITQQPAYLHFRRSTCPESEAWASECVSVPCFPHLTESEIERVELAIERLQIAVDGTPAEATP